MTSRASLAWPHHLLHCHAHDWRHLAAVLMLLFAQLLLLMLLMLLAQLHPLRPACSYRLLCDALAMDVVDGVDVIAMDEIDRYYQDTAAECSFLDWMREATGMAVAQWGRRGGKVPQRMVNMDACGERLHNCREKLANLC